MSAGFAVKTRKIRGSGDRMWRAAGVKAATRDALRPAAAAADGPSGGGGSQAATKAAVASGRQWFWLV